MKDQENIYKKIIDKYYNDLPDEVEKDMSIEEAMLSDKLNIALNKMDILKTDIPLRNINILEIIKKGEMIKQDQKNSLEFITFISLSSLIILALILTTFYLGKEFFIFYTILTSIIIPILIIPLAKLSQTGGN